MVSKQTTQTNLFLINALLSTCSLAQCFCFYKAKMNHVLLRCAYTVNFYIQIIPFLKSTSIWVRQLFAVEREDSETLIELLKLQMNVIDTDLLCLGKSALVPLRPPHDKLKINATFAWISSLYEAHIGERCRNVSPYFQLYHFYVRLTCSPLI